MRAIDVARTVVERKHCHLARPRKGEPGEYDAKPFGSGKKRGWVYVDLFTANAIVSVHGALNDSNRTTFEALDLVRMARFAMRLLRKA